MTDSPYITPKELIDRWRGRVAAQTLANWRANGKGPRFFRLNGGRTGPVLYELASVIEWEQQNLFRSTAAATAAADER